MTRIIEPTLLIICQNICVLFHLHGQYYTWTVFDIKITLIPNYKIIFDDVNRSTRSS